MPTIVHRAVLVVLLLAGVTSAVADVPTFDIQVASPIATLPFRVTDAEYSSYLDAIVAIADAPNRLHIYRLATQALTSVDLSAVPRCVSVSPNGKFAAVGHTGSISYVNLENGTVVKTFTIAIDVLDIVLAGNGYLYAFPRYDQWTSIRCIEIASGTDTAHAGGSIHAGMLARLHPGGTSIYGAENYIYPSDIEKFDIANGVAQFKYDSPYHGDYPMCGNLWFAEDGARIFTACASVFRSTNVQATDLTYAGSLPNETALLWIAHSLPGSNIAALPRYDPVPYSNPPRYDHEIHYFTPDFLTYRGKATLPSFVVENTTKPARGRWLFFNAAGTKQYVIVQADENSGILFDFGVVTIDCTNASVSLLPASTSIGASAATIQFSVTGTAACGWKATVPAAFPWLNTLSSGVGDGTVAVTVSANPTGATRIGTVSVGNATFTITQSGAVPVLAATATSPTSIGLTWTYGANADGFEVWRSTGGMFTLIATPTGTSFADTGVSAGSAYAYRVRAILGGQRSDYSGTDSAHTFAWTSPAPGAGVTIRAVHVQELRSAANALRAAGGLPLSSFTDQSLAGVVAKRAHVTEVRDAIADARAALGMPAYPFTAIPPNSTIAAQTMLELRAALE